MFSIAATLMGIGLIVLALHDIIHQLFHPSGAGSISGVLMKAVFWGTFRRSARCRPSLLARRI